MGSLSPEPSCSGPSVGLGVVQGPSLLESSAAQSPIPLLPWEEGGEVLI